MLLGHAVNDFLSQVANHVGHSHLHVQAIRCLKILCERLGQQAWDTCELNPAVVINQLEQHFQNRSMPAEGPGRGAALELVGALSVSLRDDADFASHASRLVRLLSAAARMTVDSEVRHRVDQITMRLIGLCFAHAPIVPAEWVDFWPNVAVQSLLGTHRQSQSDATKLIEVCCTRTTDLCRCSFVV